MSDEKNMYLHCPREQSDMTPCVARDGSMAIATRKDKEGVCVGCGEKPSELFKELVEKYIALTNKIRAAGL